MHKLTEYCLDFLPVIKLLKQARSKKTKSQAVYCYSQAIGIQNDLLCKHGGNAHLDNVFFKNLDYAIKVKDTRANIEACASMLIESYKSSISIVKSDLPEQEYACIKLSLIENGIK